MKRPSVGVGVLVWNDKGQILLGKRIASHGNGAWQNPGGSLEYGEDPVDCAIRELKEETGLTVKEGAKLQTGPWVNSVFKEEGVHCMSIFIHVQAGDWEGEPQNTEPNKCEGWHWIDPKNLPEPLFLPLNLLLQAGGLNYIMSYNPVNTNS